MDRDAVGSWARVGEASEMAQLLETELGNQLFIIEAVDAGLLEKSNPKYAADLLDTINSHTLGKLLARLKAKSKSPDVLETLLSNALGERNRLFHSFYREHNFRRNTDEGRDFMLDDLQSIHELLTKAYKGRDAAFWSRSRQRFPRCPTDLSPTDIRELGQPRRRRDQ